jgi:hypothetical protein
MVQTTELLEHQQREDTPEALATIPMLELSILEQKLNGSL